MQLQRFVDISEAPDIASLERQLVDFTHAMDFGLVLAVVIADLPNGQRHVVRLGNTPDAFVEASRSFEGLARDPVNRRAQSASLPFIYDQALYVEENAADLWEEQAPFGYKTGISVGLHLPERRHFLLGIDREKALPESEARLTRMLATLQLMAVHAQTAAARLNLFTPSPQHAAQISLTPREQRVLQFTIQGLTAKEVGRAMCCSEHTVNFHLRNIMSKLAATTKHQAAFRAAELGLI
jgi:DNA-binding CsgD family transcriptional regulator